MDRLEEFEQNGRKFVSIDFSEFKTNEEMSQLMDESKVLIATHPPKSVHTICNMENVRFDTTTKELFANWAKDNEPYVRSGVVIGLDGIKKIMANAVLVMSGRKNLTFAHSKEKAVEWLLEKG